MKIIHDSDCAVHNEPAYPNGPCDCGVDPREHITDGTPCWCNPETTYISPETGGEVIVHKEPQ